MNRLKINLFLLPVFILLAATPPIHADPDEGVFKAVGSGITGTAKGISKSVAWTGKGIYKTGEYLITELLRPIRPITSKMVDWFGVTVEEE